MADTVETPLAFRVVRGGLWIAASSYFNVGFGFLANLLLTRLLAPEHFGVFALAVFFVSLANLRPKLGINWSFAQRQETTGALVGTHMVLDVAAGLGTLVLVAIGAPVLRAFGYSWDVVWVMLALAGAGLFESLMGTAWVLLDKKLHFDRISVVSSVVFPLSYVPAFWLALHGGDYWSLVAQNAGYALLLLVGLWWAVRRQLPQIWRLDWQFDRPTAVDLVRFGLPAGMAQFAGSLLTQFDNFLIGTFVGPATLGFYDRAYRIAQWPNVLLSSVTARPAFYAYARLQDDPERLRKTVGMTSWLLTASGLPLALAIFASAPDLVALVYGESWRPTGLFLRFLVVYSLLRPLLDNAGSLFIAVGQPKRATAIVAVQVVVLVAAATPLTLAYGAIGTAVGVGIAFAVGLVLSYWYVRRIVALPLVKTFAVPAVATVLSMVAYFALTQSADLNVLPLLARVVAKSAFAAGVFVVVTIGLEPRASVERVRYVWRLSRSK